MTKSTQIRVVDYIADYVASIGVRHVFMLTGTGSVFLDDALAFHKNINYTCARHEAAAVLMATAAAKLTGKLGLVISTTGPGATNAIGGVVEAWVDSVPVLVLSGQVPVPQILPGIKSFGIQGFNIVENVKHLTKYAFRIDDPKTIRYHLERAVSEAVSDCPGPVWLDLPMDVQEALVVPEELEGYIPVQFVPQPTEEDIGYVCNALEKAERPLVVFGQGIRNSGAIEALEEFLEVTSIPAVCSRLGLDILGCDNPHFIGLGGFRGNSIANSVFRQADFVLSIGSSYTHAFGGEKFEFLSPGAGMVMVNIQPEEMQKPGLPVDLAIQADARKFLERMLGAVKVAKGKYNFAKWQDACTKLKVSGKARMVPPVTDPINSYHLIECLNRCTGPNHIFTNDAGGANYASSQGLQLSKGQRELTSGAFYSMGIALPMAIGAAALEPEKQIIVVTGDGSIELNIQELRTAAKSNFNIKIFIINNGGYASIRKSQDEMTYSRYTDDQDVLNFEKTADAFGLRFLFLENSAALEDDIRKELQTDDACLVEVMCDPEQEINDSFVRHENLKD